MERLRFYIMSVNFTKEEMSEMEAILSSFLSANNISVNVPVDIFKLATDLGFDVRGTAFKKRDLEGLVLVNEYQEKIDGFDSNKVIAYNCFKDINCKKFIVAHELAHYIEEKHSDADNSQIVVAAREHELFYSENIDEQRKDYIAAALLIPREDLLKNFKKENSKNDEQFYIEIANHYKTDVELAKRRVQEVYG